MTTKTFHGGTVFLPDQIAQTSVTVADGHIVDIGGPGQGEAIDASGMILAPALIDIHGDAFERQIMPRPGVFFPMDTAELIAATLWPTLIMVVHLLAIGFGTRRIFGGAAACFAVFCVAFWPVTADLHSRAGQLDHHNMQMLTMVYLIFAVIWPSRPVAAGCVGGIAAGFSLAVGVESLPFIVGGGLAIFIRAVFLPSSHSRTLLFTFCAALTLGSVLFWMGQTPPGIWAQQVCDQLGLQTLLLVAIAVVASTVPLLAGRWFQGPWFQLAAALGLTAIGMGLAWPLLSGCLAGPYGALPEVIQETISGRITEARPGLSFARTEPERALLFMLPVLVSLLAGGLLWIVSRLSGEPKRYQDQALGLLLLLCVIGVLVVFVQMRSVIMVASVVPVIGGVVAAHLVRGYLKNRDLAQGLLAIVMVVVITSPGLIIGPLESYVAKERSKEVISR